MGCRALDRCELSASQGPRGPEGWNEAVEGKGRQEDTPGGRKGAKAQRQNMFRDFPGHPEVRTLCFHCWGPRFDPGRGTKILQAVLRGQKKKRTCSDATACPVDGVTREVRGENLGSKT